jgi:hypothetical protein
VTGQRSNQLNYVPNFVFMPETKPRSVMQAKHWIRTAVPAL